MHQTATNARIPDIVVAAAAAIAVHIRSESIYEFVVILTNTVFTYETFVMQSLFERKQKPYTRVLNS